MINNHNLPFDGTDVVGTSQNLPIPGRDMIQNNAGGFVFKLDPWKRLDRFLILGTEGGTYYASEKDLNAENIASLLHLLEQDGPRFVKQVVECIDRNKAPKVNPSILALAVAASKGDDATRKAALAAIPTTLRTGTHLLTFVAYANELRGWGRGLKKAVQLWFKNRPNDTLALQLVKYKQRGGWSMRDVLRLAKPVPADETQGKLFAWTTKSEKPSWAVSETAPGKSGLDLVWASERTHAIQRSGAGHREMAQLITRYRLPRESLPSEALARPEIWEALLHDMPMTAMIRNLGNMSKAGVLLPLSEAEALVVNRLTDARRIRQSRIHPIQVLSALRTYASGRGVLSDTNWVVSSKVTEALDHAFELSFATVEPAGTRQLLAIDVSGSMSAGVIAGTPGLSPAAACATLAVLTARTEPWCQIMGFADTFRELDITAADRVDVAAMKTSGLSFGATDVAQPMIWAMQNDIQVDTFVVLTDNDTWIGDIHPSQALAAYRQRTGINARMTVVGMTATELTVADPKDPGMLDVVGFDATAPALIARFSKGEM